MSITENESTPSLTKEEKRLRKEEKRKAKAAAAAVTDAGAAPSADGEMKEKKEKKDKKEKKKRSKDVAEEAPAVAATALAGANGGDAEERPKKKSKKSKTEVEAGTSAAPAETSASAAPAAEAKEGDAAPALSKKQLKKLAKAQAALAAPASTSTVPAISISQTFTPEHNAYLKAQGITLQPSLYPPLLSIPSLPINPALQPYLSAYTKPTPIQSCSWPALLVKRDVVGIAETGSGKTLAFGVPGINLLSHLPPPTGGKKSKGGQVQMLVLAPTRELAQQSHVTLEALGKTVGLNSVCIFGGVGKDGQISELRKKETRIVVGTPGRTLDLADSGDLDLSSVSYLVLDEADRMLDQGFENDIRRIIAHTPGHEAGRQTVMFSATWPESVRRLASTFLNDPVRITVGSDELSANKRIEQVVEVLDQSFQKDARLLHHLRAHLKEHPNSPASPTRILVFALYKKEAQRLEFTIRKAGYAVGALHGDMTQDARFKALDAFKTGKQNVLVATDVAARGLDIPDVGLVINVTFPLTTEDFVHRCGRTGRAGKTGKAVTFFTGENHEKSLAGELMRVLKDAGAEIPKEMDRFPTTIKKKEHGSYGAWYKDTSNAPAPTKITFD
ncbi:ATP-dependent RNA helicase DBP3 [Kwoniella newhampshirensis]|uniref:RNA helicase n=1 Tax=Kwoniella newhampshirensis TaxID=1651941 RepID=A0AAW0YU73_9TREE